MPGRVIVITGVMASGKSTVAELLASRLPRSAHIRGDIFRRMVVSGRAEMTPTADDEATRQLDLRYDLATSTADSYAAAGFDAVLQDVIIGPKLAEVMARVRTPEKYLVVLSPDVATVEIRARQRAKGGYGTFSPHQLDQVLRVETERMGYWLDSSSQTPDETVDEILAHLPDARV